MSNDFKIFFKGDEYYDSCLSSIKSAKTQVLMESYIFEPDSVGNQFLLALENCAKRGLDIKLTVDGIGSMNWTSHLEKECKKRNIQFQIFHPIFRAFRSLNRRNHRKLIIIDKKKVFLGSFNISQVHSEKYSPQNYWRDTGISVTLPERSYEINVLIESFNVIWENRKLFFKHFESSIFRLNSNPLLRFKMLRELNERIKSAKSSIHITNPYFIPRRSILRNLRQAAKRGVQVILILPSISDVWFVREASRSLYSRLLNSGVKIFEYNNSILHAKTLIIDHWASVGSTNLNHRSLIHDLEVEAILRDPNCIQQLESQWASDLNNAKEILIKNFESRSVFEKIFGRICYWFRYWL